MSEVSKLFVQAGVIVIAAFISPFKADREAARALFEPGEFIEVFIHAPLQVLEARDPKGLYKKARAGSIKNFTGIDSPYELPENPELAICTENKTIDAAATEIFEYLQRINL